MYEYITSQSNIVQLSIEILYMPNANGSMKGMMPIINRMFQINDCFICVFPFDVIILVIISQVLLFFNRMKEFCVKCWRRDFASAEATKNPLKKGSWNS